MITTTVSNEPSVALAALCLSITLALVAGLPAARWYAGGRAGEDPDQRGKATVRTGLAMSGWILLTGIAAGSGLLNDFDSFPPRPLPLLGLGFALTFALAFSRFGKFLVDNLPLALLVGFQGFRIAVEIMLHQAGSEGVIGPQMTWSGLNFDVVSGLSGAGLGIWLWRRGDQPVPRAVVWAWNGLGLGLLATIVTIAILSMPTPIRAFDGPPNTFIATLPFVWLPTVMVTAALLGHLLVGRKLAALARAER